MTRSMYYLSVLVLLQRLLGHAFAAPSDQHPLLPSIPASTGARPGTIKHPAAPSDRRSLHGRFLHITDFHPDPFYEPYSSTSEADACHRGSGPAGFYGAETTDCDSPISLINSTFAWIDTHLKSDIDFVIWTGDNARHDNDDQIPRSEQQVADLNILLVKKFGEVFGKHGDPEQDFTVPIVPTFGNNDILPHNIFLPGPNRWTKRYLHIWEKFIPEEQRHAFERGGWFFVEVIPNTLAVFSLNTLYFFDSNTAVDGCAAQSEPGYEQFEWLRIQLQFLRNRGMKAIITGHVPPARTDSKMSWDETCWQKYAYWMQQYRDVVVGSMYGHMNIDHFMLQDFEDIDGALVDGKEAGTLRTTLGDDLTIQSSAEYLTDLQSAWADLPNDPTMTSIYEKKRKQKGRKSKKSKAERYLDQIGGKFAEKFSLSLVSPSVVPNYFPTLRIIEYNVTSLDAIGSIKPLASSVRSKPKTCLPSEGNSSPNSLLYRLVTWLTSSQESFSSRQHQGPSSSRKHWKNGRSRKPHKPSFTHPRPPPKSAPPGPAYSPQPLSWISYTQYFANLTRINGDFTPSTIDGQRWHEGKHRGRKPKSDKDGKHHNHRKFEFEIEYSTRDDPTFNLTDLTVRSLLELAGQIGEYREKWGLQLDPYDDVNNLDDASVVSGGEKHHKSKKDRKREKKRQKKLHRRKIKELWYTFIQRAYVGSKSEEEIRDQF